MAIEISEQQVVEEKQPRTKNPLDDGRFKVRESPLTTAFNDSSTLRGFFSAIVTMFGLVFVVVIVNYIFKPEILEADRDFVQRAFAKFSYFLMQWIIKLAAMALIAFPATKHYVVNREANYFTYQVYIFVTVIIISIAPVYTMFTCKFHQVLSCATVMEQIRVIMKLVAYLVENEKKKRFYQENPEHEVEPPTFKSFAYFMFAPTLIYRDSYPKSEKPTNWKLVASYAAQVMACIFMGLILVRHQVVPRFDIIGKRPLTVEDITGILLWSIGFAWFIGLAIGYAFLHCWQNMFAEIMNFGDRLFYKDWVSATDAMDFLRTWNYLIHSWIVEYLYKPVIRTTGSKPIAIFVVMAMAGIVHDYVIDLTGKYFLLYETVFIPIILFTTCWSQWMQSQRQSNKPDVTKEVEPVKKSKKVLTGTNIGMFTAIAITNMLECLIITAEIYANRNCIRPESGWSSSLFVPRIFSCPSFDLH